MLKATATVVPVPTAGPFDSDRVSCTPEVVADRLRHNEVLKEVQHRYSDRLFEVPGVFGFGISSIRDEVNGHTLAIRVSFDVELHDKDPESVLLVPTTIEGCKIRFWVSARGVDW